MPSPSSPWFAPSARVAGLALAVALAQGCGARADAAATDAGSGGATDAASSGSGDGGAPDGGSDAGVPRPSGPYGYDVGDTFEGFTLTDCDNHPLDFYGPTAVGAALTLVDVGAGWCPPCNDEAAVLEADFHQRFENRGLRIIQVLFEDDRSERATKVFCGQWREKYGLTFPVVVDPLFKSMAWFELERPPLNLLIDAGGVIRYRHAEILESDFADRIDALLPPAP